MLSVAASCHDLQTIDEDTTSSADTEPRAITRTGVGRQDQSIEDILMQGPKLDSLLL